MTSPNAAPAKRIVRLVGIYDADSTLRGELAYWVGARLGGAPVVVAETVDGNVLLLGPEDLDACGGSIESMVEAMERAAQRHGLVWTAA